MMLFPHRPSTPKAYWFVARVTARSLPPVEKTLRLRCTLSTADQTIVGVSALVVGLGDAADCEQIIELVHECGPHDDAPPTYFELVASVAPAAHPTARVPLIARSEDIGEAQEFRVAGIMDPAQGRIILPPIVLRGAS